MPSQEIPPVVKVTHRDFLRFLELQEERLWDVEESGYRGFLYGSPVTAEGLMDRIQLHSYGADHLYVFSRYSENDWYELATQTTEDRVPLVNIFVLPGFVIRSVKGSDFLDFSCSLEDAQSGYLLTLFPRKPFWDDTEEMVEDNRRAEDEIAGRLVYALQSSALDAHPTLDQVEDALKLVNAHPTPLYLAEAMVQLVPEEHRVGSVFDPASGTGLLLLAVHKRFPLAKKLGIELNELGASIAGLIAESQPNPDAIRFRHGNTFQCYQEHAGAYDLVLLDPPIGQQLNADDLDSMLLQGQPRTGIEQAMLRVAMMACAPDGMVISVVPDPLLTSIADRGFREEMVRDFDLLAVIHLGRTTFRPEEAKIQTSIIVLKKTSRPGEKTYFATVRPYDPAQEATGANLNLRDIAAEFTQNLQDCRAFQYVVGERISKTELIDIWSLHALKARQRVESVLSKSCFPLHTLKDLVESTLRSTVIPRRSNLRDKPIYHLSREYGSLEWITTQTEAEPTGIQQGYWVEGGEFLFNQNTRTSFAVPIGIERGWFEARHSWVGLKLKPTILASYLAELWSTEIIQIQLDSVSSSTVMQQSVSLGALYQLRIPLPDRDDQVAIIEHVQRLRQPLESIATLQTHAQERVDFWVVRTLRRGVSPDRASVEHFEYFRQVQERFTYEIQEYLASTVGIARLQPALGISKALDTADALVGLLTSANTSDLVTFLDTVLAPHQLRDLMDRLRSQDIGSHEEILDRIFHQLQYVSGSIEGAHKRLIELLQKSITAGELAEDDIAIVLKEVDATGSGTTWKRLEEFLVSQHREKRLEFLEKMGRPACVRLARQAGLSTDSLATSQLAESLLAQLGDRQFYFPKTIEDWAEVFERSKHELSSMMPDQEDDLVRSGLQVSRGLEQLLRTCLHFYGVVGLGPEYKETIRAKSGIHKPIDKWTLGQYIQAIVHLDNHLPGELGTRLNRPYAILPPTLRSSLWSFANLRGEYIAHFRERPAFSDELQAVVGEMVEIGEATVGKLTQEGIYPIPVRYEGKTRDEFGERIHRFKQPDSALVLVFSDESFRFGDSYWMLTDSGPAGRYQWIVPCAF